MPALDLTPALAQLAIDRWAKARSATLAAIAVAYFKPFARWAGKRGLMQRGFSELERPAQTQKKQPTLSLADFGELLRSLSDTSRDDAVRTMLMTGARCNEVCQRDVARVRSRQGLVDAARTAAEERQARPADARSRHAAARPSCIARCCGAMREPSRPRRARVSEQPRARARRLAEMDEGCAVEARHPRPSTRSATHVLNHARRAWRPRRTSSPRRSGTRSATN